MKLPKVYEPGQYEADIYALWEKSGAFQPLRRGSDKNFSILVPPPNANGELHLGHGLTLAIEDIMVRYHRMRGNAALLLPGADHAGFETQVVYEKELAKQGKSRFDFTREELYQQIWEFVAKNKDEYETQFRRLGASVDWSRYVYTLDPKIIRQAYQTFKRMWEEGLIYRGERLVNFCTFHGTSFADIEVIYKEDQSKLWYISYPLTDGSGTLTVATTRPETLLGDTAVAIHPEDQRYKQFIGKTVKLPLTKREIPVVADTMVDREFGTGAVKITPAHDPNDFEVAKRHDLPLVTIISHEGTMTHEVSEAYRGLELLKAREIVVKDLEAKGHLEKVTDYTHSVGHCYKCGTVIQPLLREQWFIDMQPLAKPAIKVLKADKIRFYPSAKRDQLIRYLEGLRDWNISRQIAWGIPIPAFQNLEDVEDWIYDERVGEETIEKGGKTYRRDPDVFDTWFSSGQWPYATLDYPDGKDFRDFYPTSLMETGADILYPWVSRMIMLGLYTTDKIPFESVYLHGLIQDEHGVKMSKSKGNIVSPIAEVSKYGSDAFRMGIIATETPGSNRPYDRSKVIGARNFSNKLWNVARFIEGVAGEGTNLSAKADPQAPADYWVLIKLQHLTEVVTTNLESYRFAEAYEAIYHFLWDDFADWYIEVAKTEPNKSVLLYILATVLKLAHPFAPFVTETIWQTLSEGQGSELLIVSSWPKVPTVDAAKGKVFRDIKTIVSEVRYIASVLHLQKPHLYYTDVPFLAEHANLITRLGRLEGVSEVREGRGLHLTQTKYRCWLDVDQESAQHYLSELAAQRATHTERIKQLEVRLANKSYIKNAPKQLVDETKAELAESKALLAKVQTEYERFAQLT